MSIASDFHVPREEWIKGPWSDEPDESMWFDAATGLRCVLARSSVGTWLGYVGVEPGHPYYGFDRDHIGRFPELDVYGGISYVGRLRYFAFDLQFAIFAGDPDHRWWFGFDGNHGGDLAPVTFTRRHDLSTHTMFGEYVIFHRDHGPYEMVYRTCAFMRSQCEQLAAQLFARARRRDDRITGSNAKDPRP